MSYTVRLLALAACALAVLALAPVLRAEGEDADLDRQTARLYGEAVKQARAGSASEALSTLKRLLALDEVKPCIAARAEGLAGRLCCEAKDYAGAAAHYEEAVKHGVRARPSLMPAEEVFGWEVRARVLALHPGGQYKGEELSDATVMKKAMAGLAGEWAEKLDAACEDARSARIYTQAAGKLRRAEKLLEELKVLDLVTAHEAAERLWLTKEGILADEIERCLSSMNGKRGEILGGHPRLTYWDYYHTYHWRWVSSGIYYDRAAYDRAVTYWKMFRVHNANVGALNRSAGIIQQRIRELESLHREQDKVAWEADAAKYETRMKDLQAYPAPPRHDAWIEGERIATLPVPTKPRLKVDAPSKGRVGQPRMR